MPRKKLSLEERIIKKAKQIRDNDRKDIKFCMRIAIQEETIKNQSLANLFGVFVNDYIDYLISKMEQE